MTSAEIHAIILTLDEEQHIGRCIKSIRDQCSSITVVDSGSKDKTAEIATDLGAEVIINPFVNHAEQVNFGIEYVAGRGGWLLRIDADEILDRESGETLQYAVASAAPFCNGLLVQRRIYFLGRRIRHGGIGPSWQLRIWRNGYGQCEHRWMDEHIVVSGHVARSGIVLSDMNLNSLTWWTAKHNGYASREAIELLNLRHGFSARGQLTSGSSPQARSKRWIKENLYARLPAGIRASLYFWYRYALRLGFLDGLEGYFFHTLQGSWYRTLVDAKVQEIERLSRVHEISLTESIRICTGIDVSKNGEKKVEAS